MTEQEKNAQKTLMHSNRFAFLSSIDVSNKIEKKNGLSYLSWAWAWSELCKYYPESFWTIYEREDGRNYWDDGNTAWVKTGVTLVDGDFAKEIIEYLPIMDFKNKSMKIDLITSMEVNKAIQRSATKAIARHGLGMYIYAGEDLPDEPEEVKEAKAKAKADNDKVCVDLVKKIKEKLDPMVKDKTSEQKKAIVADVIVPNIGSARYMDCKDPEKLNQLLVALDSYKPQA